MGYGDMGVSVVLIRETSSYLNKTDEVFKYMHSNILYLRNKDLRKRFIKQPSLLIRSTYIVTSYHKVTSSYDINK